MSKIPEGATHTFGTISGVGYRRQIGSRWEGYVDGDWVLLCGGMPQSYVPIQPETEWVPAVGSIVLCGTHNRDVEILKVPDLVPYVSAPCRALDNNELFWGGQFSPIKTPEQIEAEDRGNAILKMQEVTAKAHLWNDQDKLAALYDAGLRFVEVTK